MILTVTMNPSVDIAYHLDSFVTDAVNRAGETHKTPGGKGLNVTRVLSQLGEHVVASGLLGGKTGEFLELELDKAKIKHSFYKVSGDTRNCIAVLHEGQQTEILEPGPEISEREAREFMNYFAKIVPDYKIVAISGSLPKGMPVDYYSQMIEHCVKNEVPVVLDCSGDALLEVLKGKSKPRAIKPNIDELSQILGIEVGEDFSSLKSALSKDVFEGIEWVIVSLGSNGGFAKHGDKYYKVNIPEISVVNPVGSGDSMVAGITAALHNRQTDENLLKMANSLGMLNAQEKQTGRVNLSNYDKLFEQINVIEV